MSVVICSIDWSRRSLVRANLSLVVDVGGYGVAVSTFEGFMHVTNKWIKPMYT